MSLCIIGADNGAGAAVARNGGNTRGWGGGVFNCDKATRKAQKLVCAHSELSNADRELNALLDRLRQENWGFVYDHGFWVQRLYDCQNIVCIQTAYADKKKNLRERVDLYCRSVTRPPYCASWRAQLFGPVYVADVQPVMPQRPVPLPTAQEPANYCKTWGDYSKENYTDLVCSSALLVAQELKRGPAESAYVQSLTGKSGAISAGARQIYLDRLETFWVAKRACESVACLREAYDGYLGFLYQITQPVPALALVAFPLPEDWWVWGLGVLLGIVGKVERDMRRAAHWARAWRVQRAGAPGEGLAWPVRMVAALIGGWHVAAALLVSGMAWPTDWALLFMGASLVLLSVPYFGSLWRRLLGSVAVAYVVAGFLLMDMMRVFPWVDFALGLLLAFLLTPLGFSLWRSIFGVMAACLIFPGPLGLMPQASDWGWVTVGGLLALTACPVGTKIWRAVKRNGPRDVSRLACMMLGMYGLWGLSLTWIVARTIVDIRMASAPSLMLDAWALAALVALGCLPLDDLFSWTDDWRMTWASNALGMALGRVLGGWLFWLGQWLLGFVFALFGAPLPPGVLFILAPVVLLLSGILTVHLICCMRDAIFALVIGMQVTLFGSVVGFETEWQKYRQEKAVLKQYMRRFASWLNEEDAEDFFRDPSGRGFDDRAGRRV